MRGIPIFFSNDNLLHKFSDTVQEIGRCSFGGQCLVTLPMLDTTGVMLKSASWIAQFGISGALARCAFIMATVLHDPDDDIVLECAMVSGSQYIVTHNVRDFRRIDELQIQAVTPADFLRLLRT